MNQEFDDMIKMKIREIIFKVIKDFPVNLSRFICYKLSDNFYIKYKASFLNFYIVFMISIQLLNQIHKIEIK